MDRFEDYPIAYKSAPQIQEFFKEKEVAPVLDRTEWYSTSRTKQVAAFSNDFLKKKEIYKTSEIAVMLYCGLKHLVEVIASAEKYVVESHGDLKIFGKAMDILCMYANSVYDRKRIIDTPDINLCEDDSIDLEWDNGTSTLLLRILSQSDYMVFYGETIVDEDDKDVMKGQVKSAEDKDPSTKIVSFLTDHLSK